MTEHVWPTAPVIRARWREHGYNNFGAPATYFYDPDTGDYISRYLNRRYSPRYGDFQVVTEYVDVAELEKRLDQIRQLENALRKKNLKLGMKNATIQNLEYQRKLASGTIAPPRAHIFKRYGGWVVYIRHGVGVYVTAWKPTHAEAMRWAENKLKELAND